MEPTAEEVKELLDVSDCFRWAGLTNELLGITLNRLGLEPGDATRTLAAATELDLNSSFVDWNPLAVPMGMISMAWTVVPSASPIQPGSGVLIWTPPWVTVVSMDNL